MMLHLHLQNKNINKWTMHTIPNVFVWEENPTQRRSSPKTEMETDQFYGIGAIHTCSSDPEGTRVANLGGQGIFAPRNKCQIWINLDIL